MTDNIRLILDARKGNTDLVYLLDDMGRLNGAEIAWLTEHGMYDRDVALYGSREVRS